MKKNNQVWDDPIIAEVRAIRDKHARQFNYDLTAIVKNLMKQQQQRKAEGKQFVTFPSPDQNKSTPRNFSSPKDI